MTRPPLPSDNELIAAIEANVSDEATVMRSTKEGGVTVEFFGGDATHRVTVKRSAGYPWWDVEWALIRTMVLDTDQLLTELRYAEDEDE